MQAREHENERRDWIIILLIILLGFLCVIVAGQWAVRFSPSWKLDTNMGSNLNPNSDFLTSIPNSDIAPVDPAILTPPSWLNFFLTPGASFKTNTPIPTKTNTPTATSTAQATSTSTATFAPTATPTMFVMYITSTSKPPSPSTATPTSTPTTVPSSTVTNTPTSTPTNTPTNTPAPVDLQIAKSDGAGVTTYAPGSIVTYNIIVTNNSAFNVNGATVTDVFPLQISSATWICLPGSGASCTANGTGNISDSVNLPAGGSVTYTVSAKTLSSATGNLSNTASVAVPSGYAEATLANNSATDIDIPSLVSDLAITVNDGVVVYKADDTLVYTVVVSNYGPSDLIGVSVNSTMPTQVSSWNWVCTTQTNASGCTGGNASSFIDTLLDIQSGGSIEYTVTAQVSSSPSGNLMNSATVTSGVYDPVSANNSDIDTDELATAFPSGLESGATPGGAPYQGITDEAALILVLPKSIIVDGSPDVDLIYYEEAMGIGIRMDWIRLDISDGSNWYPVFTWGDGFPDTNTNISVPLSSPIPNPSPCNTEPDNCDIDASLLDNVTGITINADIPSIPLGTYSFIRITAIIGSGTSDGGVNIDGIYVP